MKPYCFSVPWSLAGKPLQVFLAAQLGISKRKAKALLDTRGVFVNRRRVWMAHHTVQPGDSVEVVDGTGPAEAPGHVAILYEDADVVVADKPAGILSNGHGSVESILRLQKNEPGLEAVHRLDRDTSGCLVFARRPAAARALEDQFRSRDVGKQYHAIVAGRVAPARQAMRWPVDGQPATTGLFVLDARDEASHVRLEPLTGRTHQIRIHLRLLGHPVVGDRHYGASETHTRKLMGVERQMLHAWTVEFVRPSGGMRRTVKAPLPRDFRACLRMFRLD
jgi:RluA family pseudouridine synthase